MRGSHWVTFHPDWYLDLRRPEWAEEERLGYVKFMDLGDGKVVGVHCFHGSRIINTLSLRKMTT